MYIPPHTVNVAVANPDAANTSYNSTPANTSYNSNTLSSTCPIMVYYHAGSSTTGTGIVPVNTLNIVAALCNNN
jgi:hypothetical protein